MIYRQMQLPAHSLENLPRCQAILKRYSETYEESYARRLIWAFLKLKEERGMAPINWSDLRTLSGVKKQKIDKVVPCLYKYTSASVADELVALFH